jgi:hypothetical protein
MRRSPVLRLFYAITMQKQVWAQDPITAPRRRSGPEVELAGRPISGVKRISFFECRAQNISLTCNEVLTV